MSKTFKILQTASSKLHLTVPRPPPTTAREHLYELVSDTDLGTLRQALELHPKRERAIEYIIDCAKHNPFELLCNVVDKVPTEIGAVAKLAVELYRADARPQKQTDQRDESSERGTS